MENLSFGVIGLGNMGKVHAQNLFQHRIPGVSLGAVCDVLPAELAWSETTLPGVPRYADYATMLEQESLDAVVVVTPHYSHIEIASDCLKKGLHVLIEKPLAVSAREAESILALHRQLPQQVCGVAFNQRSNRVYQKAKALLPALGTLRSGRYEISDWYRPDSYYQMNPLRGHFSSEGGGGLINQCHHQLDLVVWLLGLPDSVEASCKTINRCVEGENDVLALFHYPTFDFVFTASLHDLKGINYLDISGDKGRLDIEKKKLKAYFHEDEALANTEAKLYGGVASKEETFTYGAKRWAEDQQFGQQWRALKAFADEIRGQVPQLATLEDGLRDVQLLNAIYYANWTHEKVTIPVDETRYEEALADRIKAESSHH